MSNADEPAPVTSRFVRNRNALLLQAVCTPLYVDYYLHLMQHTLRPDAGQDAMLKDALAAMALHMASRPHDEVTAWTLGIQHPLLNLFVTGNNRTGTLTGRSFTEEVRGHDENLFFEQVVRGTAPPRQSVAPFPGADVLAAVEAFYRQSQQLPARLFRLRDPEEFAMLVAQPDCDLDWLESMTPERVETIQERESLQLLETRLVRFSCECTLDRIIQSIAVLGKIAREELFEDTDALRVTCPRCGAGYIATRAQLLMDESP